MKKRSPAGPLILILLGGLFLVNNLRPDLPLYDMVAVYWPFLLIAWGAIRLVEVITDAMGGRLNTPGRRSFSPGEVVLVVFICLIGSGLYSAHRHGVRFGVRGLEMFGDQYDYTISQQRAAAGIERVVFDNPRGNVRITGGGAAEIRITGRKQVRALSKTEADRTDQSTPVQIDAAGSVLTVRVNQDRVTDARRVSADLEVVVPRHVSVEMRGRSGDFDVTDVAGGVEISSDRSDVRLNKIGGNARIDLRRSGLVRLVDVKGNVDLQGKGSDVELENVAGQVTVSGSYGGTLEFKNLAKALHFESQNTELRVAGVPGQVSFDLGEFTARNVIGPMRLTTKSKDVRIQDFTESLELETERGDIELTPGKLPVPKIEARSKTGKIDLILPSKATFQLQATTDHGDAVNDFGPGIQKESEGRSSSLKGKVGEGQTIHLTTERGTVAVRKAELVPTQL